MGEAVSEELHVVPARIEVIRHVRRQDRPSVRQA
ncbi:IS66 family transposase zinc-finger binding domain-containing protein [Vreelandella titanicae]|nr:IS66 family transposase zinc-finger binding domain-containing protein [Halomonas titanicae]